MDHPSTHVSTSVVAPATASLQGRNRAKNALRGVLPGLVAVPLVLSIWCPRWFVIAWTIAYCVTSAFFIWVALTRYRHPVAHAWSSTIAVVFCAVPISTVVFSARAADFWAAGMIGVVFIAFEMSAAPFLPRREWRASVALVGAAIVVCGVLMVNPIVALAFAPVVYVMVQGSNRIQALKSDLEGHLAEARRSVRDDSLTGVLSRRGFAQQVDVMDGQEITVVLIDIDRFKIINDSHGHQVGDGVLVELAAELIRRFNGAFSLARLGGDEFVAIGLGNQTLTDAMAAPVRVDAKIHGQDVAIDCGLSIGVSCGINVDSAERLLSEAGTAMRASKRSGASLTFFDEALAERLDRKVQLAALTSGSTSYGTLLPVAQSIVEGGRIVGCELLIRWQRSDGELLSPADFLPEAADAGLMSTIDNTMIEHAIRFAARLNNRPNAPFVSANISSQHLGEVGFFHRVESLLKEHRVPARRLMIEITEDEQLSRYTDWEGTAAQLRRLGVQLAIDDFGTGYSSIERLQRLPISHLKFDRSLVQTVSGPAGEIVRGVARFAQAVNIGIIAEGVETLDELESVRSFGVSTFQGYYFHRPEPLDAVEIRIIEDDARARDVGSMVTQLGASRGTA